MIVAPSILSADFSKLLEEVKEVENHGATYLHIDVMDGHFVPNITMGPMIYKNLRHQSKMIFDVHLMISDPKFYAQSFIKAGADIITFHIESVNNVNNMQNVKETIEYIKGLGAKVGISLRPNTIINELESYLSLVDLVLVMSVEPGFGGQSFMMNSLEKIKYLKEQKNKHQYSYLIEVDGGINLETAKLCKEQGAEVLVAGTYIFGRKDRNQPIKEILAL